MIAQPQPAAGQGSNGRRPPTANATSDRPGKPTIWRHLKRGGKIHAAYTYTSSSGQPEQITFCERAIDTGLYQKLPYTPLRAVTCRPCRASWRFIPQQET